MQKNKLAMCKRIFKDFQAKKLVDDKNFLVIDWKNKNGSGEYSIRDVGYCIASWYNHLTPDNLCKFLNNIGYFKEKINCWTESYTYRYGNTIGHISERFHKQFSRKMSYKDMVQYIHEHETSKYTNHVFTFTFTKTGGMKAYA